MRRVAGSGRRGAHRWRARRDKSAGPFAVPMRACRGPATLVIPRTTKSRHPARGPRWAAASPVMNGGATGRVGAMPPDDLQVLASQVRTCTRCRLAETRTFAVPGSGDPDAPLMLVAEAPGAKEDATGLPFQGMAGRFLNRCLVDLGVVREQLYITSTNKCRPPGNRAPKPDELAACAGYLDRQLVLVKPDVVLAMAEPQPDACTRWRRANPCGWQTCAPPRRPLRQAAGCWSPIIRRRPCAFRRSASRSSTICAPPANRPGWWRWPARDVPLRRCASSLPVASSTTTAA